MIDSGTPTLPFTTASDADIKGLLTQYQIGLTVEEAKAITTFLNRDPTVVEAVIWGIQGSEHCSYKSSRRFLKAFPTSGKHVILGPVEDSGVVAMTDGPKGKRWGVVISHESHNHPSQIVPFEGSATGVGGVVRDVVCMGARIVGCMDNLRLGDLKTEETRAIAKEVMRGIGGYGNPLGIPNLGGDTVFDASYNSNCLVNAVAVGIVREDEIIHSYVPDEAGKVGYDIIIVGKPTDRSGFGGASFASVSMEEDKREQNSGAVQEPNPFLERHLLASCYALFDWIIASGNLPRISCKDLGAGGVVCSTVEQVADKGFGAEIDLGRVHTAMAGLPPEVIGCAETQERFCFMCHPDLTDHILKHFNEQWDLPSVAENARASVIGKVTEGGIYRLTYEGSVVTEAKALDITSGLRYVRPTKAFEYEGTEPTITCKDNKITVEGHDRTFSVEEIFKAMLTHRNGSSRAPVYVHYDKNVIGNTIIEAGEADAAVIAPLQDLNSYVFEGTHPDWDISEADRWSGVAVASDGSGRYGRISPYLQGLNASVESMRNVVATGATPRSLTDCLNYGNPEIPEQLWQLEEGVRGIADAAKGVEFEGEVVPIISGNVSLYNGKPDGSAIDPTALVCCIGTMADARKAVTMQFKSPDSVVMLIGERKNECGGSLYYNVLEEITGSETDALLGRNVPAPDTATVTKEMNFILHAIQSGSVRACHDVSDGGLLMALFEMTLPQRKVGGAIGVEVDLAVLQSTLPLDKLLFSETGGFLIEVPEKDAAKLQTAAKKMNISVTQIGHTTKHPELVVNNGETAILSQNTDSLKKGWATALARALNP